MQPTPRPVQPARAFGGGGRTLLLPIMTVLVGAAAVLPIVAGNRDEVRNFSLIFSSIMLEAMPFMLLGTLAAGLIEAFVSRQRMASLLPRRKWAAACAAAALGIVFPVCECAIVPVVRRLAAKGLPPAAAVAYLLAGPIVNPVVAASTLLAYNLDPVPMALRLCFGYLIAVAVALLLGKMCGRSGIFIAKLGQEHAHDHGRCACGCGHGGGGEKDGLAHHHHDGEGCCGSRSREKEGGRLTAACNHALDDFMATAPYLVAGAAIAAIAQTCLERRVFVDLAAMPLFSSAVMMLLAVLLNLCSEADAFIAASFRGLVPFSAQMAFLVLGPMFDIKLLLMYRLLFRMEAVIALVGLVVLGVTVMAMGLAMGGL